MTDTQYDRAPGDATALPDVEQGTSSGVLVSRSDWLSRWFSRPCRSGSPTHHCFGWAASFSGLTVLAIAQMGVHLVFFLHVTTGPDNTNNVMALAFGVLIVALVVVGSLLSSEHFGPPDRYYWDSIWSLAGLQAAYRLLGGDMTYKRAAIKLRRALASAWATDMASLGRQALVAAPGRGIDLGMIGTLVSWFPLRLMPTDSPLLEDTLSALEEELFYQGALFVNTGHSGWGTYLNMRLAGCRILQGSPKGWEAMLWLLRHASPTYNWPEAIHPRSLGGSAGDGQHGWASAEWLLLVRALLLQEERHRLILTPALPQDWLSSAGCLSVESAPTRFGSLTYRLEWDDAQTIRLEISPEWRSTPPEVVWHVPGTIRSASVDGNAITPSPGSLVLPPDARNITIEREKP